MQKSFLLYLIIRTLFFSICEGNLYKKSTIENEAKKVPIEHVEGVLGQRVELPCDISANRREDAVYMVLWFSESHGKPLYSFDVRGRGMKTAKTWSSKTGFDRRADFQAASYPAHLLVDELRLSDQGLYRCRVDFKNSRTRNSLVNLTVVVPPSYPIIYDGSDEEVISSIGPLVEDSDVHLKCRVRGGKPEPTVSWYVNGALMDSTFYLNGYGDVVNELHFPKVNRSHLNSVFTCKATNTRLIQPVEKSVSLDLNLRPLFVRLRQRNMDKILAGKEYRVSCETAGSKPQAVLRWIKDGKEITQVNTQEMDNGNVTTSTFVFLPKASDNGGSITCRAENPKINSTHIQEETWNLNVVYLPEVRLSLGSTLNPLEIKEGTDVYFECKIQANPKVSKLIWLFNNEELKHNIGSGIIMSNQSLVLQGINRNQNGNYSCIATNAEGSTTSNQVPLSVMYTPVCLAEGGVTVGGSLGESIGLRCGVESNPTAFKFEWEFHGVSDSNDIVGLGKIVSHGDLSRFFYSPSSELEFGTFLCWGSNYIGRQIQPCVFHVVAAVKPHPLENCTILNQTDVSLNIQCSSIREIPPIPDQPLFRIMSEDESFKQDPVSYGILPEFYICEIVDMRDRNNRRNLTSDSPFFNIRGFGSGSWLKITLYAGNSHGKSEGVVIETLLGGDAVRQALGEKGRKSMEFYPMVAIGIGAAISGTLLIFTVLIILRSKKFTSLTHSPESRRELNGRSNGNSHNVPINSNNEKNNSLKSPHSHIIETNGSNSPNNSPYSGYRQLIPPSKTDDPNPDIIPGANNFQKDFDEEMDESDFHKIRTSRGTHNHEDLLYSSQYTNIPNSSLLNGPIATSALYPSYPNSSLERLSNSSTGMSYANITPVNYSQNYMHNYSMNQSAKPPNCLPSQFSPSRLPPNDYNTIYIRDKLFHDSDIPESCV